MIPQTLKYAAEKYALDTVPTDGPSYFVRARSKGSEFEDLVIPANSLKAANLICEEFNHARPEAACHELARDKLRTAFISGAHWIYCVCEMWADQDAEFRERWAVMRPEIRELIGMEPE